MSRNKQKPGRAKRTYVPSVQQLASSPGPTIRALGKTWRLGFNDQNAKGALEELIRSHHTRIAVREKRSIGGEEGELVWAEFCALKAKGFYDTFGKGWQATLQSQEGVLLFLQSLLTKNHPDITTEQTIDILAAEPEEAMAALEVVAPDFFEALAIQMGHSTNEARAVGQEIARQIRAEFATEKAKRTTPEPATDSTTAPT